MKKIISVLLVVVMVFALVACGASASGNTADNTASGKMAEIQKKGTYVLMKSASKMAQVKELIKESGRDAVMVENCGAENEKVYHHVDEIPDDAGYYSLIIAREKND